MLEKGKISARQFTILVFLFMIGTSILIVPSMVVSLTKQDGWISVLIGIVLSMLSILLYYALAARYPDKSLAEYCELILGKWLGKLVSLFLMSYIFLLTALLLRVVGNFMTTEIMPETPIEVIHILIVAVVIYAVRLGIETFSRTSEIMLPVILVLFLLFAVLLLKEIDMERIQPVMEWGMRPVLLASFYFFSLQELVVFLMLVPYVNRIDKVRRSWMMGTMLGGVVLLVSILLCILVLGSDFTARNMYPTYTLAKQINVANFLQKVESVIAVIWLITIFFKITISYYAAILGMAQSLGLKDYRTLTLPLGIILVVLSIVVYKNIVDYIEFTPRVWSVYAMVSMVVIPLLLLLVDLIRSKLKPST